MLARFFYSDPQHNQPTHNEGKVMQSRFQSNALLKTLDEVINKLITHKDRLKISADANGAASPDFEKYIFFAGLLDVINNNIELFNQIPKPKDHHEDIQQTEKFIKILSTEIRNFSADICTISLNVPRNKHKESVGAGIEAATAVAVISTVGLSGSSLFFAYLASVYLKSKFISNKRTRSILLWEEFKNILMDTQNNIQNCVKIFEKKLLVEKNRSERKWGAFALCANASSFNNLPFELKVYILSFVLNGSENEFEEEQRKSYFFITQQVSEPVEKKLEIQNIRALNFAISFFDKKNKPSTLAEDFVMLENNSQDDCNMNDPSLSVPKPA